MFKQAILDAMRDQTEIEVRLIGAFQSFTFHPRKMTDGPNGADRIVGDRVTSIGTWPPKTVRETLTLTNIANVTPLGTRFIPKDGDGDD